ncbi:protein LAZY 1-like isoform X1 [Arachis stenosperma]|uniref:protein LAZY 1-like isoform X1 n=2 Tax=Arachis stenosperma TaxID=217475 RepID=UPI0025AD3700|nr:protein LAZY 1-like isoform X1 [Arachis stenosperma]
MKLLGWMHRKFRQNNSSEPFKDLVIGNSCNCLSGQSPLDDEQNYLKPNNHGVKLFKNMMMNQKVMRKSFAGIDSTKETEDYYIEPSSMCDDDLFPGFLAIGTLGSSSDQVVSDPTSTPTFAISVESITQKEDEVTENDLKLINDELEKVLGAETNDDVSIDYYSSGRNSHVSTGRNSHVSTGRSSHVSIITLSGKPITETHNNNNGGSVCPLQGYLFGTAIELSETTRTSSSSSSTITAAATTMTTKKEHRTSLGELFQRSKLAEECAKNNNNNENKEEKREGDKSAMNMVKEKLKKRILHHASSRNSTSMNDSSSCAAETKLNKILHMFRKKVHPESSTAAHKYSKQHRKNENKKKIMSDIKGSEMVHPDYDENEDSFINREHWIKTDADYLVLEL